MEYEKIKQLMDDMGNSKLTSLDIEFPDGIKIKMEKKEKVVENKIQAPDCETEPIIPPAPNQKDKEKKEEKIEGNIIKSPMVGTFYIKPSPDAVPYVEIGKDIKKGDILCIIEAMKLMNEIESEYSGKVAEIFLKDGEAVEYGTPLFRIV